MSCFVKIAISIGLVISLLFVISLVVFYFYRERQVNKVKVIKFINDNEKIFSTYNIHQSIFENKKSSYVVNLLKELEDENIITKTNIGNSEENGIWEIIDE